MADNALFNMFLELSHKKRIPLEIGQLYLLGTQINGLENKSKHIIELVGAEDTEQKHCVIDVGHSENVFVYDLFSLKGTLLNNKLLKGLEKLRLKNGDILKVGNQEIKFIHDKQEMSHDSSGFLETNKNTSDIITSSPDSTSHPESRLKRNNYNFLVPSIPPKKSITPNTSLVILETESDNINRNSLNASSSSVYSNNRRSDSFVIPETQYCKHRSSLNASDLSIAESIPDDIAKKNNFNFGNLDDLDDDFCIPETQEILPPGSSITSSQRPRLLSNAKERSILVEESSNAHEEVDGSQIRICTQDYNEGFGEEAEGMQSQIIPLIKHNTVILNASTNISYNKNSNVSIKSCNENVNNKSNSAAEKDEKELSALKWSNSRIDQENTELRADCSTPDIFEFADKEQPEARNEQQMNKLVTTATNVIEEDEEDLLPTQAFPMPSTKTLANKSLKDQDKPCVDKEPEDVLTLSDKENRCPVTLEPITDLPPTQLFSTNEVSSARSTTSTSSRNSLNVGLKTNTLPVVENKNNSKLLLELDPDDEDDLLTQAFLQPSNPPISSTSATNKNIPIKCFNSTVLEDNFVGKNLHTFFAEMEKTPLKQTSSPAANAFKVPDKDFSVLKKTSAAGSTISENDLDLLMCTPQLIKDHMFMDRNEDLKKNILAAKNRNLFGEDTDDDNDKVDEDDDQEDLVKLINVPKDTLDFDKLLPHLNKKSPSSKIKKEETKAKEANKVYKFNSSFDKEQEQTSISKSSTLSRDERHVARDKERELAERKERSKTNGESSNSNRKGRKPKETEQTKTSSKEDEQEENASNKQDKPRQHRKRRGKVDKTTETAKESMLEEKSKKEHKIEQKNEKNMHEGKRQTKEAKTAEVTKDVKVEDKPKEIPARRMTRAKSRLDEAPSSSKETASKSSTKTKQQEENEKGDDLDSVATQPFVVRVTRRHSTSKQSESQSSITSNNSRKSSQHNKSKNDSSLSHNGSITTKPTGELKRKSEPSAPVVPAKIERKRLRSTHFQDSAASTTSSSSFKVLISMTMVDQELFRSLVENSKGIWYVAKDPADSEILVMDKAFRTFKFLLAMARGIPIVTSEYLKKLNQTQSLKKVKINDYLFKDAEFEKKHKCSLLKSQQMAKKHKLFKDYEFVMTANILPNPREIHAIIVASGGFVHAKTPPPPKDNQQIYLVTSKEDKKDWHKFRRLNKNIVIVSTEAIMSAIMRQCCEAMSSYTLA